MSEASDLIQRALARGDARAAATPRTDYDALNRMVRRQRSALTRARKSGDPERVVLTVRDAVAEWEASGVFWPDDWARWQNALDDAVGHHVELRDLI